MSLHAIKNSTLRENVYGSHLFFDSALHLCLLRNFISEIFVTAIVCVCVCVCVCVYICI